MSPNRKRDHGMSDIYYPANNNTCILPSIIVAGVYSRPRPIELVHVETGPVVVLLHVEVRATSYARCQNRASSFHGTDLYFFTAMTGPLVLGLFASTRIESTASRYCRP